MQRKLKGDEMRFKENKLFSAKNTLYFVLAALLLALGVGGWWFFTYVYQDYAAVPELTINGDAHIVLEAGETYAEPGAAATVRGEDITANIEISEVDTTKLGTQEVTYRVTNIKGRNPVTATRTVEIKDTTAPVITVTGGDVTVYLNQTYSEKGATALDSFEGDLTSAVKSEGSVDTAKLGVYTITYTVADSSGNTASATRTVTVRDQYVTLKSASSNRTKYVYLTFDDGPSARTSEVLDLLKKYNAKATFFVIGSYMGTYGNQLTRMANEGHAIALHSNTHNYAGIYKSSEAFWSDQAAIGAKVASYIGKTPTIFRFPGGGSNTVSRKYCSGIMTTLAAEAAQKGLRYYDWNISSGDASGNSVSAVSIANNVLKGINAGYATPIVLMHDAGGKHTTVQALEVILKRGTEAGYVFVPITSSTPTVHQKIAN